MHATLSESAIRRALSKAGLRLQKTPPRHPSRDWYGPGYMVVDNRNTVVLGATSRPWDATLMEVEAFAARG